MADRDRALLAESRAAELSGDHEDAIRLVEQLLGAHADDATWAQAGGAEKALRRLLTGNEASVGSLRARDRRPARDRGARRPRAFRDARCRWW